MTNWVEFLSQPVHKGVLGNFCWFANFCTLGGEHSKVHKQKFANFCPPHSEHSKVHNQPDGAFPVLTGTFQKSTTSPTIPTPYSIIKAHTLERPSRGISSANTHSKAPTERHRIGE